MPMGAKEKHWPSWCLVVPGGVIGNYYGEQMHGVVREREKIVHVLWSEEDLKR